MDYPRTHSELAALVERAIAPLAEIGDPVAILLTQCLTCENVSFRCADCWQRVGKDRNAIERSSEVTNEG